MRQSTGSRSVAAPGSAAPRPRQADISAGTPQSSDARREPRIIERPRLIKLLDETDARTILLLAPAGYGKTTLARQWAKTLNGAVWITLTPADRDIAVLAGNLAHAVDPERRDVQAFVAAYLSAHTNPQRMSRELALVLASQLTQRHVKWVVVDDYHEVLGEHEAESLVEILNSELDARFLVSSRLRPTWATARLAVYGDVFEIDRNDLSMTVEESRRILGRHPELEHVVTQADGWPAVIGLAASARDIRLPGEPLESTLLHAYLAEEVFKSASEHLQRQLIQLALAPDVTRATINELFGEDAGRLLEGGRELGFINAVQDAFELHPLVRDFLLRKLRGTQDATGMVADAIASCVHREYWERAFDLILRFERDDLAESVLEAAYMPLIRAGQTATLAAFAAKVRAAPRFPPAVVDLAEADVALADGAFSLASRIAARAVSRFSNGHHLIARAQTIVAESAYARAQPLEAETAYKSAFDAARTEDDAIEALRGWALSSLQGETPVPGWVMDQLQERRTASPLDLVRQTILELSQLHFTAGFSDSALLLAEADTVLEMVDDPRARSSLAYVGAYVTALCGEYDKADRWQRRCDADIAVYDLDFAQQHAYWNRSYIAIGLRKFGAAERMLQRLEDSIIHRPLDYHVLNARILRGRLSLQTGKADEALTCLAPLKREVVIPSIYGEYLATRALALAVRGENQSALEDAARAERTTRAVEVRVLAAAATAIAGAPDLQKAATRLWELADELHVWDPLLAAVRASGKLADAFASVDSLRPALASLYQRSRDLGLARRAGLRIRAAGLHTGLLSPRELEILGLLGRGFRNREVAEALVLSQSTVKVHVRHIYEKLGVRTRAEAVTRLLEMD